MNADGRVLARSFPALRARALAALTRRFGLERLSAAEAAVQDAAVRALERLETDLPEDELERWLVRTAHNALVDALRRQRREVDASEAPDPGAEPPELHVDDELRLVFLACHPALPRASQVALTLRVVYGFTSAQIARALVGDERAVAQRIVRAKQALRAGGARLEVPDPGEIPARLEAILDVVYQVLTEGAATTHGEEGIDDALCHGSLRLLRLLGDEPRTATPGADALRALAAFTVARLPARRTADGGLLLLREQDRARWDPCLLTEGFAALARSARGVEITRFHLEAGIAACHAAAPSHDATDWARVVAIYDALLPLSRSPVVEVNRALAVAMVRGAEAGLDALDAIDRAFVSRYPYALAVYAELRAARGEVDAAATLLERALALQPSPAERRLLRRKLAALRA